MSTLRLVAIYKTNPLYAVIFAIGGVAAVVNASTLLYFAYTGTEFGHYALGLVILLMVSTPYLVYKRRHKSTFCKVLREFRHL